MFHRQKLYLRGFYYHWLLIFIKVKDMEQTRKHNIKDIHFWLKKNQKFPCLFYKGHKIKKKDRLFTSNFSFAEFIG